MTLVVRRYFVYGQIMDALTHPDTAVSFIASAIGEPGRTRMLYALMDGRARTSTELGLVAEVAPSTASVHLSRLRSARLVRVFVQGRHRYYSLAGPEVARALERLSVLAGGTLRRFTPAAPFDLRAARSCYDHMAGAIAVALHDQFLRSRWIRPVHRSTAYQLTPDGEHAFASLGLDVRLARARRRRLAYACLDWSERRPHLGGALAAAFLSFALSRGWVARQFDSRALTVTRPGHREFRAHFGLEI